MTDLSREKGNHLIFLKFRRLFMFNKTLVAVLMVFVISIAYAGEITTVSGTVSDAYADQIHMYVNENFMSIEKVPPNIMKKIWKLDKDQVITLKIEKQDGKFIFKSLENK
jgi:hypothetical protein